MTTRRKVILSIIGIIVLIYLGIYTVLTPFIRGVVVDETTKQPVENAWVMATASIGTRTIAGDVGGTYAISRRHLRTGKDGVFYIFPKLYPSIPTPYTFGNMKKSLNIIVRVMDGRRAEVNLTKSWWKRVIFATVPVIKAGRTEEQLHYDLSYLIGYCVNGMRIRGNVEVCDMWELEYTIAEHERYIKALEKDASKKTEASLWWNRKNLAYLYMRKGEYKKALDIFIILKEQDTKRGSRMWLFEYETQIDKLRSRLKEK